MAVTVSTTDLDEARDLAKILGAWFGGTYRIYLQGREFTPDEPVPGRDELRAMARVILDGAGPAGITLREMSVQLYSGGRRVPKATLYRWLNGWLAENRAVRVRHGYWAAAAPAGHGRLDPRHVRLRELLAASPRGYTARQLGYRLSDDGQAVAREELQGWLARDEQAGLISRSGDCWIRRNLPARRSIPEEDQPDTEEKR